MALNIISWPFVVTKLDLSVSEDKGTCVLWEPPTCPVTDSSSYVIGGFQTLTPSLAQW